MQYLESLLAAAAALTAEEMPLEAEPAGEILPGERLLGVIPEDVRRFYHLFTKIANEVNPQIDQIQREADTLRDQEELTVKKKRELTRRLNQLNSQRELIERLFWESVRHALPDCYGVELIALRTGWQVVEQAPEPKFSHGYIGPLVIATVLDQIMNGHHSCPECQAERTTPGQRKPKRKGGNSPSAEPQTNAKP